MAGILADAKKSASKKADYQARAKKAWDTRGRNPKLYAAYKARKAPTKKQLSADMKSDTETAQATLAYLQKKAAASTDPDKARKLNDAIAALRDSMGGPAKAKVEAKAEATGSDKAVAALISAPITATKKLGGGAADTSLVTLKDGSKAVFKTSASEVSEADHGIRGIDPGLQAEREAASWEVASLVGMDDIVAPTALREHQGEHGSITAWKEGTVAAKVPAEQRFANVDDLQRAALFDFVTGQQDRHSGNWLVKDGRLMLIDHGISFSSTKTSMGGRGEGIRNAEFIERIGRGRKSGAPWPKSPAELAATYVQKKAEIRAALTRLKIPEAAIERALKRIDRAATYTSWDELVKDGE